MNKKEIIEKCKKIKNIDFIIGHGSALVMYEIRNETSDIDASCSVEEFNELEGKVRYSKMIENYCVSGFDIHAEDLKGIEYEIIEGLKVTTLQQTIKDKMKLGRKKDFEQIELIKKNLPRI